MSRGKQTAIQIVDEIGLLTHDGFGPSQIFRDLEKRGWLGCDSVSQRTVQAIAKEVRGPVHTDEPWSFADSSPAEARLVLDVLSAIVPRTDGRVWFTTDLARWVARVREAAPIMPPEWVHIVARCYQWSKANKRETHALDLTLVMAPWEAQKNAEDWARLLRGMGERVGDWPGGGPGLMAIAAQWFSRPGWVAGEWGSLLWDILLRGVDAVVAGEDESGSGEVPPAADNKLTTEPVDSGGRPETEAGENRPDDVETGPG